MKIRKLTFPSKLKCLCLRSFFLVLLLNFFLVRRVRIYPLERREDNQWFTPTHQLWKGGLGPPGSDSYAKGPPPEIFRLARDGSTNLTLDPGFNRESPRSKARRYAIQTVVSLSSSLPTEILKLQVPTPTPTELSLPGMLIDSAYCRVPNPYTTYT
jgi:hypothetical protein